MGLAGQGFGIGTKTSCMLVEDTKRCIDVAGFLLEKNSLPAATATYAAVVSEGQFCAT